MYLRQRERELEREGVGERERELERDNDFKNTSQSPPNFLCSLSPAANLSRQRL